MVGVHQGRLPDDRQVTRRMTAFFSRISGGRGCAVLAAAVVALLSFTLAGCSGAKKQTKVTRDPLEVYEEAMASFVNERYESAETSFKELMESHPMSPYSLEAQLMLGDTCFKQEKYDEAAAYYTNFVALHPTHERAAYALFQKGMSHFKDVLTIDRDQTSTRKALFAFEDLVANYPDSPYYDKAEQLIGFLNDRLAEREFYVGKFYFKNKNYKGALGRFRDILEKYPDSGLAEESLYYIGETYLRLGETSLAEDVFKTLASEYPDGRYGKYARLRLNGD